MVVRTRIARPVGGPLSQRLAAALSLLLLSMIVSGCIDDDVARAPDATTGDDGKGSTTDSGLSIVPPDVGLVDPWLENETERILFDEKVTVSPLCSGMQEATLGSCPWLLLPDDAFIPIGTKTVRIDVDATDALKSGGYHAFLYTRDRDLAEEADGAPTTQAAHTWEFALMPTDWDIVGAPSTASFGIWPSSQSSTVFNGQAHITLTAVKDPAWTPTPTFVSTLLDWNGTWEQPTTGAGTPPLLMQGVPTNTTELSVAIRWTETTCPDGHDCAPNPSIAEGTTYHNLYEMERAAGAVWYTFPLPGPSPDAEGAEESAYKIYPFVWKCHENALNPLRCFASFYAFEAAIDVRIMVQAWDGPMDAAKVRAMFEETAV